MSTGAGLARLEVVFWLGGIVAGAAAMYAFMLGGRKDPRGAFTRSDVVSVLVIVFVLVALTWWRVTTFIA